MPGHQFLQVCTAFLALVVPAGECRARFPDLDVVKLAVPDRGPCLGFPTRTACFGTA